MGSQTTLLQDIKKEEAKIECNKLASDRRPSLIGSCILNPK